MTTATWRLEASESCANEIISPHATKHMVRCLIMGQVNFRTAQRNTFDAERVLEGLEMNSYAFVHAGLYISHLSGR